VEILRNLWRRKLRTGLTILGILMGTLALTTMGAMSESFSALFDGGIRYYATNIQVADSRSSGGMGGLLNMSKVSDIQRVDGVQAVFPSVMVMAKPGSVSVTMGVPDYVGAVFTGEEKYSKFPMTLKAGRMVGDTDRGVVTLGSSFAREFKKGVGDVMYLPVRPAHPTPDFVNHPFKVVGLINPTNTAPDSGAMVSLYDAQQLLVESLPAAAGQSLDPSTLITGITVYGNPGVNLDSLADRINAQVAGVKATRPSEMVATFKQGSALFSAITLGAALLAVIIGSVSIINTMVMNVTERYREIGLKKALGAQVRTILGEFVAEAAIIGLIGGVLGVVIGYGLAAALNAGNQVQELFLVTPRLLLIALGFAVLLGAGAGLLPAIRASRLDPVTALRSQ